MSNITLYCRSCCHGRAGQIDFTFRMAHSAYKVPVGGRNGPFTTGQDAHMAAKAGTAGRGADCCTGSNKDFNQAFLQGLHVYLLGTREDDTSHIRMNLPAIQYLCCYTEVLHPAVCTGTDNSLVYLDTTGLTDRSGILRQVGESH